MAVGGGEDGGCIDLRGGQMDENGGDGIEERMDGRKE